MKKRAVLYPVSDKHIPILLYNNLYNEKYEIVSAVACHYVGEGRDVSYLDNRDNLGMPVKLDLRQELMQADALFVPDVGEPYLFQESLVQNMKMAAGMGKDVICNVALKEGEKDEICKACLENHCVFTYGLKQETKWKIRSTRNLQQIPIPVVWIGETAYPANETEIVFKMAARLQMDGYRVSVLGMRPECNLFGFHYNYMLAELLKGNLEGGNLSDIVFLLNLWANYIVGNEKSDILLIEVPGAALECSTYINECGIYSYIVSRAIIPDYAIGTGILSDLEFLKKNDINKIMKKRYGFCYDCFHISNKVLNNAEAVLKKQFAYMYVPLDEVRKELPVKCGQASCYNLLDDSDFEKMYQEFLNTLGEENE